MLHGMLADKQGEFFIEENSEAQSQSEVCMCVCVYYLDITVSLYLGQASSIESSEKVEKTSSQKSEDESEKEDKSGRQFTINPALVPAYIPFRVIEKVCIRIQQCIAYYLKRPVIVFR